MNKKVVPETLYQFDKSHRILQNIRSCEIFFGSPKHFNDPFDSKIHPLRGDKKPQLPIGYHHNQVEGIIGAVNNVRLSCFTIPPKGAEFPENSLMWSHYAASHTGACLKYNGPVLCEPFDVHDPVEYFPSKSQKHPEISLEEWPVKTDDYEKRRGIIHKMLFSKSKIWDRENEYRIFLSPVKPDTEYPNMREVYNDKGVTIGALYKYKPKTLEAVYWGVNATPDVIEESVRISRGLPNPIDIYKMNKIDYTFDLKPILQPLDD